MDFSLLESTGRSALCRVDTEGSSTLNQKDSIMKKNS